MRIKKQITPTTRQLIHELGSLDVYYLITVVMVQQISVTLCDQPGGLQKAFGLMKNHIFRFLTQQNLNDLHNEHFPAARFHIISTEEEVRSGGKLGSPYMILLP